MCERKSLVTLFQEKKLQARGLGKITCLEISTVGAYYGADLSLFILQICNRIHEMISKNLLGKLLTELTIDFFSFEKLILEHLFLR